VVGITKVDEAAGKPRTLADVMANETYAKVSDRFYTGWGVDSTQISVFPIVNYKHGVKVKSEDLEIIVFSMISWVLSQFNEKPILVVETSKVYDYFVGDRLIYGEYQQ